MYAQCWNLVWEDEFDGISLDSERWSYQTGGAGWGNNEWQYYTAGENVEVQNGSLKIIAREDAANQYPNNDYTSSRIRSQFKGDWRYGKLEASIKLPFGQGIWPAFWMMPSESVYGGWPSSGEIDIMEYLGHETDKIYGTCHYGHAWNDKGSDGESITLPVGNFPDGFHTFGIEWEPGEIRWYLDGNLYHTIQDTHPDFSNFNWPFDQEFHFILNVAVGGNWPGYPDASTSFPQIMEVDWVRVYQEIDDIALLGVSEIQAGETGTTYTLPLIDGANYFWTVPQNALITSGQNTNEITVNWGYDDGTIEAEMTTACGTAAYSLDANVSSNIWENFNFEDGLEFWNTNQFNATADFTIVSTDVQEGSLALCVSPTSLGANPWDIQLSRANLSLVAGEKYEVNFWAKADANGKDINLAFINSADFTLYTGTTISITDEWENYSYSFIAPVTATALFNIDLADEFGEFCFDDFSFGFSHDFIEVELECKIFLEGPYLNNGQMQTIPGNLVPISQPYNQAPYDYMGTEVLSSISVDMVDWVLVEARLGSPNITGDRATVTVARRAAVLLSNGEIVDLDGSSPLLFDRLIAGEDYHFCIRHRNHLDVLTASTLVATSEITYDFSGSMNAALGAEQMKISDDGYAMLLGGEYQKDGTIQNTDFDEWIKNPAAINVYLPTDGNLDGVIQNTDFDLWFLNKAQIGISEIQF